VRTPAMKRISLGILVLWLLVTPFTAAARDAPPADTLFYEAKKSYYHLLSFPEQQEDRNNWLRVVARYEALLEQYPDFAHADDALNTLASLRLDMYRKFGRPPDLSSALSGYRRLWVDHPTSRYAEWALFVSGELLFRYAKAYAQADQHYRKLISQYPNSKWSDKAKLCLKELASFLPKTAGKGTSRTEADGISALKLVKNLRYWSNPTYTRVVLDVEGPVNYKQDVLRDPDRLYIDLEDSRISPSLKDPVVPINDGLLKRARIGQNQPDTVRVVLDMDSISQNKIFALDDPYRLVIDIMAEKAPAEGAGDSVSEARQLKARTAGDISIARQLGLGVETIVIDPGHGGKDPGAVGPSGILEKDITLDVAIRLKPIIEKQLGCKVILTRDSDVFVPLEERTAVANMSEADLFVSIHANAHRKPTVSGVETFCLNFASSEEAAITAARENQTSLKTVSDLQTILTDLLLTSKLDESNDLAASVQHSLVTGLGSRFGEVTDLGVKEAPFYVLIGAQMPSILVEIGFITNSGEERRLRASTYRQQVAQHIVDGLKQYIEATRYASLR